MTAVSDLCRRPVGLDQPVSRDTVAFDWVSPLLGMPFDTLRWAYAAGVQCGVIPKSLLASHKFGLAVVAAEQMALGPWARQL